MTWGYHPMAGIAAYIFLAIVSIMLLLGLWGELIERHDRKESKKKGE